MSENIKEGDKVQLKSGGPEMTVSEIKGNEAHCLFFVKGEPQGVAYPLHTLEKVPVGTPPA